MTASPAEIAAEAARVAAEMPALLRNGQDACVDRVLFIGVDNDLHSIEFRDIWALLADRERLRRLVAAAHLQEIEPCTDNLPERLVCTADEFCVDAVAWEFNVLERKRARDAHAAHVADVLEGRAS